MLNSEEHITETNTAMQSAQVSGKKDHGSDFVATVHHGTQTGSQTSYTTSAVQTSQRSYTTQGVQTISSRPYTMWIGLTAIVALFGAIVISLCRINCINDPPERGPGAVNNTLIGYFQKIDIATKTDTYIPKSISVKKLHENMLIVVDRKNKKIKLFDLQLSQVTSELKLGTNLWDVSVIDEHKAAVTHPWTNCIQFVSISENTLSLGQKIKTRGWCYRISYWDNKLAVTCWNTTAERWILDILDLTGNVLHSISPKHNGQLLFGFPASVIVSDDKLYVSDTKNKTVFRLSVLGEVKAVYNNTDVKAYGLIVNIDSTVYLCDYLSNTVYQLDSKSDGMQKVELLSKGNREEQIGPFSNVGNTLFTKFSKGKLQMFHWK